MLVQALGHLVQPRDCSHSAIFIKHCFSRLSRAQIASEANHFLRIVDCDVQRSKSQFIFHEIGGECMGNQPRDCSQNAIFIKHCFPWSSRAKIAFEATYFLRLIDCDLERSRSQCIFHEIGGVCLRNRPRDCSHSAIFITHCFSRLSRAQIASEATHFLRIIDCDLERSRSQSIFHEFGGECMGNQPRDCIHSAIFTTHCFPLQPRG